MSRSVQNDYDKLRNPGPAQGGLIPKSDLNPEFFKMLVSKGCVYVTEEALQYYGEEFMAKLNEMKLPDLEYELTEEQSALMKQGSVDQFSIREYKP